MPDRPNVTDLIRSRFSCRKYLDRPIDKEVLRELAAVAAATSTGPLGSRLRFQILAATEDDRSSLGGLGTYGTIRNPAAFIAGAVEGSPTDLEDYGFALERIVLEATRLGLGTCWLGGLFTRSSFARRANLSGREQMPAVVAAGHYEDPVQARRGLFRWLAGSDHRLGWDRLFFRESLNAPLPAQEAGPFSEVLEMVRLAPSASNKQPWRIVRAGDAWHFFVRRTPGYASGLAAKLVKMADIQRLDIGIAMCHFQLTAQERGLRGTWTRQDPGIELPDSLTEYRVSWVAGS